MAFASNANEFIKSFESLVRLIAHVADVNAARTSGNTRQGNHFFRCCRLADFIFETRR